MKETHFDQLFNVRDLGGLRGEGGKYVRPRRLLRSAHLGQLTKEDIRRMKEVYHLRCIVDFRSEQEVRLLPDVCITGARYLHLPVIDEENMKRTANHFPEEVFADMENHIVPLVFEKEVQSFAASMYPLFLESPHTQRLFGQFLKALEETRDGCLLWHCSQGKDRTGWAAAFVLAALGVDENDIIADFDRSNQAYRPLMERIGERIKQQGGGKAELETMASIIGVSTPNFRRTLSLIREKHGSLTDFMIDQLGFSTESRRILQDRLLTENLEEEN